MDGRLVVVATPIGNLGDLAPRARQELEAADLLCCEDTRRTRVLLSAVGVPARGRLVSLHRHNEAIRVPEVLERIAGGQHVVLVSDAGTPAVSDPGSRLIAAVADAGHEVRAVPGPSAALAALVVSGLATDRFAVEGFLPRKGPERRRRLGEVAADPRTTVLFEAPSRLAHTLGDLAEACGDRSAAVARELTKVHEEVWRATLPELARRAAAEGVRGEVVVVVAGAPPEPPLGEEDLADLVRAALAGGVGVRDAASAVAASTGVGRRRVYELALRLSSEGG